MSESATKGTNGELLEAHDISVHFEGLAALDGLSVSLGRTEIFGLIGPNGSGKTTLVNVLTGFQKATAGTVTLGGRDITDWPPYRIGRAGLARTFQAVRLFRDLTVLENLEIAGVGHGLSRRTAEKAGRGHPGVDAFRAQGVRPRRYLALWRRATCRALAARSQVRLNSCFWTSRPLA